jgi:GrpB-like predicted nucleotidyltransferase (UPF0157 family)
MDEIEIVDYDPQWPSMFEVEAKALQAALPPALVTGLEHFGSTAIPGLAAKPIIDILIAVPSLAMAHDQAIEPLEALGYLFWDENPKTDRMFFVKGLPPYGTRRTHHVHITEKSGELWQRLAFRDYLLAHPGEVKRYADLKRELAVRHRTDREAYTLAKADYVEAICERARWGHR